MRNIFSSVAVSAALLLAAGCGGNPVKVKLAPVSGTIKYQGQPVADANVIFIPADGPRASGTTDAEGKFKLMTLAPDDGATLGDNVVLIEKSVPIKPDDPYSPRKAIVPSFYSNPQETTVKKKVVTGANDFQIDLQ
jgi:hypothetical protein